MRVTMRSTAKTISFLKSIKEVTSDLKFEKGALVSWCVIRLEEPCSI